MIRASIIFEMIARIDKDFCPFRFRISEFPSSPVADSSVLQLVVPTAITRLSCLLCVIDQLCLILLYYVEFGMHMVAFHVIYF